MVNNELNTTAATKCWSRPKH